MKRKADDHLKRLLADVDDSMEFIGSVFNPKPSATKRVSKSLSEAQKALCEDLLAALPRSDSIVQPDLSVIPDGCQWIYFMGQKYAITQMEQSIRSYFGPTKDKGE